MERMDIEVWLAVNDEGACVASFDGARQALADLLDQHGGAAARTVKLPVLNLMLPTAVEADPIEVLEEAEADDTVETAIEEEEVLAA